MPTVLTPDQIIAVIERKLAEFSNPSVKFDSFFSCQCGNLDRRILYRWYCKRLIRLPESRSPGKANQLIKQDLL